MGQFGAYHAQNSVLRLSTGQQLTVYRVKTWTFSDGGVPALQLEYESPVSVSDTAAVRRNGRLLWPTFARYLGANGFRSAIVTATNLRRAGRWPVWGSTQRSYGLVADRDSSGLWRFEQDADVLPPADSGRGTGIYEYSGALLLPTQVLPPPH
jgi:hypothetical protein